jgi:4-hydroxy-4-methyl-2-oxoglutarate aldolase
LSNGSNEDFAYLGQVQTGVVTDALVRLGLGGWMDYLIPLQPKARILGRALTVKYAPKRGMNKVNENLYSIIRRANPGDILVIEALGTNCWILGENIVHAAMYQGMGGLVLDGRVRDSLEISELDFPTFSRGPSVRPHAPYMELVDYNVPILCAGAQVHPGDIIVGDPDGIVVVPQGKLDDVLLQARDIERLEKEQEKAILKKASLGEINEILKRKKQLKQH